MLALEREIEFANFFKHVRDKTFPTHKNPDVNIIEIPTSLFGHEQNGIISSVFCNIIKSILPVSLTVTSILAPKIDDYLKINNDIREMLPGHYTEYCRFDEGVADDEHKFSVK